jgi:hypothetical protein
VPTVVVTAVFHPVDGRTAELIVRHFIGSEPP